jgi:hypothetical protein
MMRLYVFAALLGALNIVLQVVLLFKATNQTGKAVAVAAIIAWSFFVAIQVFLAVHHKRFRHD